MQTQQHEPTTQTNVQQQQHQDELYYVRELEQRNTSLLESTRILQVQQLQQQPQHHSPTKPETDMDTDSTNSETSFSSTIFNHSEYPTLLPKQQQHHILTGFKAAAIPSTATATATAAEETARRHNR